MCVNKITRMPAVTKKNEKQYEPHEYEFFCALKAT